MRKGILVTLIVFFIFAAPAMALWQGYGGAPGSPGSSGSSGTSQPEGLVLPSLPDLPAILEKGNRTEPVPNDTGIAPSVAPNDTILATSPVASQQPGLIRNITPITQPGISSEKKNPWPFILIIIFILLAIIFAILYMKNKRFHKGVENVRHKIDEYEHDVYDLIHNPEKAREHLKTHKPHPRHAHPQGHLRGIPHYHHSLAQLHTYIENALRKGYTYKEVRTVLIPKGWSDDDILNAYKMKGFRNVGGHT